MIRSLTFTNFLSFGREPTTLTLGRMNLLIGPNASGKSNLVRGLRLLNAVPVSFMDSVREGGSQDWSHKAAKGTTIPRLQIALDLQVEDAPSEPYEYRIAFDAADPAKPAVAEEVLVRQGDGKIMLENRRGAGTADQMSDSPATKERVAGTWAFDRMDAYAPFLQQVRSPRNYPTQGAMAEALQRWAFYGDTRLQAPEGAAILQRTDLRSDRLMEDGSNLAALLHERGSVDPFRDRLREAMQGIYDDYRDFHVKIIQPGFLQLVVSEKRKWGQVQIPATRLSSGTLGVLKLFAILADPSPPPLIVLEEPEVGLHPDAIVTLARLLKDAATRTQLIVTTHSEALVDAFSETPEDVVICERKSATTSLIRLNRRKLAAWLKEYSLGSLWLRGDLGGTRW